jgi:hypothetical protein
MKEFRVLWITLLVIAVATPIGLYLPRLMKAGAAWGEWGLDEIAHMIGYTPAGMKKTADTWKAPLPDYALPGQEDAPLSRLSLSYILSALVGIGACGGGGYLLARWLTGRRGKSRA